MRQICVRTLFGFPDFRTLIDKEGEPSEKRSFKWLLELCRVPHGMLEGSQLKPHVFWVCNVIDLYAKPLAWPTLFKPILC